MKREGERGGEGAYVHSIALALHAYKCTLSYERHI